MLMVNGKKFAKNDKEFTDTLFQQGGTAHGFYKAIKGGIQLFNIQHELIAFIVNNSHGEQFFVTASKCAGKARYMFSTDRIVEKYLGLDTLGYLAQKDAAHDAINSLANA